MKLTLKAKLLVSMLVTQKYIQTLTLLVMLANLTLVYQCLSLRIFFDHNPICHGFFLTLFLTLGYLGNPSMILTSKAKVLVSLVRSCKYLHTFSLLVMGPLNSILAIWVYEWVLSKYRMTLTSKANLLVSIVRPQKCLQTFALLSLEGHLALF